jgi:hypothetical protein
MSLIPAGALPVESNPDHTGTPTVAALSIGFIDGTRRGSMDVRPLFGLSVLMSFVSFGLVTKLYIWPQLRLLERDNAIVPLVLPHTFAS